MIKVKQTGDKILVNLPPMFIQPLFKISVPMVQIRNMDESLKEELNIWRVILPEILEPNNDDYSIHVFPKNERYQIDEENG